MRISDWSSDVCSSDLLTAPNARPETPAETPAATPAKAPPSGSPTPLFVPPTAGAGEPQQSGALESGSPESDSGEVGASVILSAAERLMQAPDWADFEPGVLIPEIPVPVTTTTPPASGNDRIRPCWPRVIGHGLQCAASSRRRHPPLCRVSCAPYRQQ